MLNLFFRKNFYDGWDNILLMFIPNLILNVFVYSGAAIMFVGRDHLAIWFAASLVVVETAAILSLCWAETAAEIADYGVPNIKDFFKRIKTCIKDGLLFGLLLYILFWAVGIGYYYYFKMDASFVGITAGCMFVWISIAIFMILMWYPAMRAILKKPFSKTLKKCFIVMLDNFGKSLIIGLYCLFLCLPSIVLLGLIPGMAGLVLARVNALRLILKKYDYLEQLDKEKAAVNDPRRRKIPWKDLLDEDEQSTGTRSLGAFIFPWKE